MTEIKVYQYVMFGIILIASVYGMLQMFKKRVPVYFMLYICGAWCFAVRLIYIFLIQACGEIYNEASSLSFLGIGGMFAFFATANYGTFNSLIDDRGNKIWLIRIVSHLNALLVAALIALEVFFAHLPLFNIITLFLSLVSVPCCVYFSTKILLMRSNGDTLLMGVKPLNFSTLLICFGILAYIFFRMIGSEFGANLSFGIYTGCVAANVFLADWGRKQWLK